MDTASRVSPLRRGDPERLGEYRITGRLGSGGMGVVYLATDRDDYLVAIKLVHATLVNDPEFRGRFRSEVERARQVPSFCTAEVLDADLDHNPPYLVVEYVDGPSLAEVVEESGPLKAAALHSLAVGVATALTGIHGAGVIHRDLKPGNVLLAPGSPKVIDFGIARAFEATSQHTRTDQMVGTVAYMAPERFSSEPGRPLTAAADVFAWGCVVAYAGTGRTPFHGDSPPATAARILTQPPHLGGLPEPLRDLVELSLSKHPEDRPTARELLDLLLGDRPTERRRATGFAVPAPAPREEPAPPAGYERAYPAYAPPGPARRPRGHRTLAVLAVLLVLAGLATVALVLNAYGPAGAPLTSGDAATSGPEETGAPATDPADNAEPGVAGPAPVDPGGGETIIQDPLSGPGLWPDSEVPGQDAGCLVRGVLRATRSDRGTHQCAGPDEVVSDDTGVEVTTALQSAGSCAAIWFHWDSEAGGQLLRVCQGEISVAADLPEDRRVYGRVALERRIGLRQSVRIHLVVREGKAQVFRDGDFAGAVTLPPDGPNEGQVLLGLSAEDAETNPPYAVTFANVEIQSL
ncbi:protein kinase domain-containing protein [Actinoplanes sp. NPDC049118]|uniref:serine/threonine-protein kinase n=1 Tax=Actinoplanes sp. NPDC049118 TaxID=3155769 RepID=UPI0033C5F34D